jgi:hypothetical protein
MSEKIFPIQLGHRTRDGQVRESVYMAAYEVYAAVYGEQKALIDHERGCRGGFGRCELVAFLYARSFPRQEWPSRVDEAFREMKL